MVVHVFFEDLYRGRWTLCKKGVRWEIERREFGMV